MSQNAMIEELATNHSEASSPQEVTSLAATDVATHPTSSQNGSPQAALNVASTPTEAMPNRASKPVPPASPTALQDMFLNGLRRENIDVVVYFCDGSQERGAIRAFDTFTVLLENRNSGKSQLIYKHAIARIFPTRTPSQLNTSERTGNK